MATFFVDYSAFRPSKTYSALSTSESEGPSSGCRSPNVNSESAFSSAPRLRPRATHSFLGLLASTVTSSRSSLELAPLGSHNYLKQSAQTSLDAASQAGSHPSLKLSAPTSLDLSQLGARLFPKQSVATSLDVTSENSGPHSVQGALLGRARSFLLKQPAADSLDAHSSSSHSVNGAPTGRARAVAILTSSIEGSAKGTRVAPLASMLEELEVGKPPVLLRQASLIQVAGLATNVLAPSSVAPDDEREGLAQLEEEAAGVIGCAPKSFA